MRKTFIKLIYWKLKYEKLKLKNLLSDHFISRLDAKKIKKYYTILFDRIFACANRCQIDHGAVNFPDITLVARE